MVQDIIVLIIVTAVVLRVFYSVYKAVTVKDKSLCGGCASCELKHELKSAIKRTQSAGKLEALPSVGDLREAKKRGRLQPFYNNRPTQKSGILPENLRYHH